MDPQGRTGPRLPPVRPWCASSGNQRYGSGRTGTLDTADADFRRVTDVDLGDHFEFIVQTTELAQEDKEAGGAALRYRVQATLAGRVFERVLVDVGFTTSTTDAEVVEGPDLLDFAGLQPVRVPALPVALHVAEKVHAYTRRYGPQDAPSSRPKDLVDLILLATHEPFLAGALRHALEETFVSQSDGRRGPWVARRGRRWAGGSRSSRPFVALTGPLSIVVRPLNHAPQAG